MLKRKEQEQRKNVVASCVPLTNFSRTTQPSTSSQGLVAASSGQINSEWAASSEEKGNEERGEDDGDSGEDELNEGAAVTDESGNDDDYDDDKPMGTSAEHPQTRPFSAHFPPESDQCASVSDSTAGPSSVDFLLNVEDQHPADPFFFKEKPLTPELIRALMEHGPCQPGPKESHIFAHDEDASVQCGISAL